MNTIQGTQATAAATTTSNALTGNPYAVAPYDGYATFSLTAEAAGESRVTIYIGPRLVAPESSISRQNRVPIIPDDFFTRAPMRRGEQIVLQHRNTGAGSNTLFWRVDFTNAQGR